MRRKAVTLLMALAGLFPAVAARAQPDRAEIERTMERATRFMTDRVATHGGYVWTYLPDLSRRWGEMEAEPGMIWVQAPGTATMGRAVATSWAQLIDAPEWSQSVLAQSQLRLRGLTFGRRRRRLVALSNALIWDAHDLGRYDDVGLPDALRPREHRRGAQRGVGASRALPGHRRALVARRW